MTRYDLTYQSATGPTDGPEPGTKRLADYLEQKWPATAFWGIYNPRKIGGTNRWSTHAEGRGLDLGIPLDDAGLDLGNEIAQWLIDHAEQLGCQYLIWNGRSWSPSRGWRIYTGQSPHRDHIHLEQTRRAAAVWNPDDLIEASDPMDHIIDIADPVPAGTRAGREPFWSVYADGRVEQHNGARNLHVDLTNYDLAAPITGGWYRDGVPAALILVAAGDGGTFRLETR